MKNIINTCAALMIVLPFFAHAADGADAVKRFQERNKAMFAQQAKARAEREQQDHQASKDTLQEGGDSVSAGMIAE